MAALTWLQGGTLTMARLPASGGIVGRDPNVTVPIRSDDRTVSRQHARITRSGDGWAIENLSAANPVRVNGALLNPAHALADRDRIELGTTVAVFHDLANAQVMGGLVCSHCRRENPVTQKDCWFCGENMVNANSVATALKPAACRLVSPHGPMFDVFAGQPACIDRNAGLGPASRDAQCAWHVDATPTGVFATLTADGSARPVSDGLALAAGPVQVLALLP